jgi:H+-transporting ATPase
MTLSIVIFNFYPITALMIILLALLNDLPILAIAYDHTRVNQRPVRWKMQEMLTISTALGVTGVIGSFLLFYLLQQHGFSEGMIQSMMFLKLIVAGHSTLYITRTEGWFWEKPYPAPLLFSATFGTEILGTLIAVYGVFITPIGWKYALWMWAYALLWFVVDNSAKMLARRFLNFDSAVNNQ